MYVCKYEWMYVCVYCTVLGVLARFCPIIVQITPLKTPFGLVTPFITVPITRSCNHTQLLLTPLHNYNPCAFVPTITYCTVTLLTINSLCCRSSILRLDSFFSCQPLTDWLAPKSVLKTYLCGRDIEHRVPRFVSAVYELVAGETSVVYLPCIAAGLFLE
jgi:hypothetical protein